MTSPKPAAAVDLEALKAQLAHLPSLENEYACARCKQTYWLDDEADEATPFCDGCAHEVTVTALPALIAELEQLRAGAPKWIACADRMPELAGDDDGPGTSEWVTVYAPARGSDMAFWDGNVWQWRADGYAIASEITHWMTLPVKP